MAFNTTQERKVLNNPVSIVCRVPNGSKVTINLKVGDAWQSFFEANKNEAVQIDAKNVEFQVVPEGSASFEIV